MAGFCSYLANPGCLGLPISSQSSTSIWIMLRNFACHGLAEDVFCYFFQGEIVFFGNLSWDVAYFWGVVEQIRGTVALFADGPWLSSE